MGQSYSIEMRLVFACGDKFIHLLCVSTDRTIRGTGDGVDTPEAFYCELDEPNVYWLNESSSE
jgi:hypothetical protein